MPKHSELPWKEIRNSIDNMKYVLKNKNDFSFSATNLFDLKVILESHASILEKNRKLVEALKKAKGMLDYIPCPQNCEGGAFRISEEEWTGCQWCSEKEEINQAIIENEVKS